MTENKNSNLARSFRFKYQYKETPGPASYDLKGVKSWVKPSYNFNFT